MRSEGFVALRREDWNRLEDLLARGGSGHLNALTPAQVLTMAALYRRATADLARAQRDWPDEPRPPCPPAPPPPPRGPAARGRGSRSSATSTDSWAAATVWCTAAAVGCGDGF